MNDVMFCSTSTTRRILSCAVAGIVPLILASYSPALYAQLPPETPAVEEAPAQAPEGQPVPNGEAPAEPGNGQAAQPQPGVPQPEVPQPGMPPTPELMPPFPPFQPPQEQQPTTFPTPQPIPRPITVATTVPMREFDARARVMFNFSDASVDSILDYLSEALGFIIIREARIDSRVSVTSRQAVNAAEAVDLLNTVLRPLNYTAVQSGRTLRILNRDKAKKSNIPVHYGADPKEIRDTDDLITQVIPLGQVDAVRLRQDLTNLFSPDADIASNAGSNTIIITDSSANIRRIVEIIAALNRQTASSTDIKVFQLEFASAANAARLINEVFKTDDTSTGAAQQRQGGNYRRAGGGFPGFPGFPGAPGVGGQPQGASDSGTRTTGKVIASSDDRTNTLVVTGPKDVLPVVERVVRELDANPAEESTVFVYSLRNGQAQRLQDVLNTLFGASTTGGTRTTANQNTMTRQPFGSSGSSSSGGGVGGNLGGGGRSNMSSFGGNNQRRTGTGFGANQGGLPQLSAAARSAAGDLAGQVYVVADTDTNSLIVTTSPAYVDRVKLILTELDRSVPQVLIKVLIAEVTHENGSDIGFQASYMNRRANGMGTDVGTDFGLANANGGMVVSMVEGDFQATLRALATEGKVDVLSRPYILASDNQLASILVGQQVPFVTNTRVTDTGQTINTVEYQDIGIILDVTPHINPDGKVIMDVAPEISSLLKDTEVRISDTVTAPVFSKRSAQSRVAIENGKTIVIGGLMEDKKDLIINKVPILGDIPFIGNAFRRTQTNKSKTELLIFLTPHVAMESSELHEMSKDEMQGVKITPDAVAPGTFQEHMQGMQRGATTQPSESIYVPTTQPLPPGAQHRN